MQQKTLSLPQFQKKFGTEKACQKHLFRLRWPEGFRCPRCENQEAYFHRTRYLYHCKACGYQASLTAGTIFHKTRTPLTKWFWMIWLMGRQKSGISMLSLQRMLDIPSYKWTTRQFTVHNDVLVRFYDDQHDSSNTVTADYPSATPSKSVFVYFEAINPNGEQLNVVREQWKGTKQ
jgi:transposase-like protein